MVNVFKLLSRKLAQKQHKIRRNPPTRLFWRWRRKTILFKKKESGRWHITTTCVYVDQLQRITWHVFQSQRSDSFNTWDICFWWLVDTRNGTAKSWGHGPWKVCLSVDDDTEFRSRCEWIICFFTLKYSIFPIKLWKQKIESVVSNTPGWWGWKLCLEHCWMSLTVGLQVVSHHTDTPFHVFPSIYPL